MSINRQYYIHRLCYENWPDFLGGVDLRAAPLVLDSSLTILADRSFMKLPNGERADLGTKLEDYVLNPSHLGGTAQSSRLRLDAWYYSAQSGTA